jgi:phytoene dehydrogenase-like protein
MIADAVVIGSGPNGLVAANMLADAGWDVLTLEAQPDPGGAVRTGQITVPGFHHDLFSAFYPLGAASPAFARLHLEEHGLRWLRAPLALAHPTPDGNCAVIAPQRERTEASLEAYTSGDGTGWRRLMARWDIEGEDLVQALLSPFPPVRAGMRLAGRIGMKGLLELGRTSISPVRCLADEHFRGEGGALLLAGNALHADLSPESAASGLFGWMLCSLAQNVGFPVPQGGAASLTAALVTRFERAGGQLRCGERVDQIVVRNGRSVGVRTASGEEVIARHAVLADVDAPQLYRDLLSETPLSSSLRADVARFQWDAGTVKVDWALDNPIPWSAPDARLAGTVHLADSLDHLTRWSADLATHTVPARPFMLCGQQSMTDPTRQPPGTETAWAYTHVPRHITHDAGGKISGKWDADDEEAIADRLENRVEEFAPGFRSSIRGRHVFTPPKFEMNDVNLNGGAINGGTSQLHQQLVFRPIPGLGRAGTFISGLYLASASAHPGGGVHGACGANAARAALAAQRLRPSTWLGSKNTHRATVPRTLRSGTPRGAQGHHTAADH